MSTVYTKVPELHLDLVGQQEIVLFLDVSTVQGRELHLEPWTYSIKTTADCSATGLIYTTEACAASRHVYTQGPELHLDLAGKQEPVLLLDVSTVQGRELHLESWTYSIRLQ
jgi:hypothetical protein